MLDFDFEKLCSVSLSNNNVYACLVCGKYFQGMSSVPCVGVLLLPLSLQVEASTRMHILTVYRYTV